MIPKIEKGKLFLFVTRDEYCKLIDLIPSVERISSEDILLKGLDNLILDYPNNRCIAVLDIENINEHPTT